MLNRRLTRSVGYCDNEECEQYLGCVFLLNHGLTYDCPACKQIGSVIPETSKVTGEGKFAEVRMDYEYDPKVCRYRSLAIVRNNTIMPPFKTYNISSPLVKTEKRALKVSESILARLQYDTGIKDGEIVASSESVLYIDGSADEFKKQIQELKDKWHVDDMEG